MKHAPGPWSLGSDEHGDEYRLCIVQNKSWRGQQFIARAEPYGSHEGLDEAEANARLIAAAPALYEALEDIRKAVHAHWNDASLVDNEVMDRVDAALALVEDGK